MGRRGLNYRVEDARFTFDAKLGRWVLKVDIKRLSGIIKVRASYKIVLPRVRIQE